MGCCLSSEQAEEAGHELGSPPTATNHIRPTLSSTDVEFSGAEALTSTSSQAGPGTSSRLAVPEFSYSRAPSRAQFGSESRATSCYVSESNGQSGSSISFGSYSVTDTAGSSA